MPRRVKNWRNTRDAKAGKLIGEGLVESTHLHYFVERGMWYLMAMDEELRKEIRRRQRELKKRRG